MPTMAISNCSFSLTSENPLGFSAWCVLAKLSANPRNYSQPRPLVTSLMKQLKAKIKYLKSFLKSDWSFNDYPLETWKNPNAEQKDLEYGAKFTNWWSFLRK